MNLADPDLSGSSLTSVGAKKDGQDSCLCIFMLRNLK
jgi:hypothetical protein